MSINTRLHTSNVLWKLTIFVNQILNNKSLTSKKIVSHIMYYLDTWIIYNIT